MAPLSPGLPFGLSREIGIRQVQERIGRSQREELLRHRVQVHPDRFPVVDQGIRGPVQLLHGGRSVVGTEIFAEGAVFAQPPVHLAIRRRVCHAPYDGPHHGAPQ